MKRSQFLSWVAVVLVSCLVLITGFGTANAQEEEPPEKRIQLLTGQVEPGTSWVYRLADLTAGEKLYVRLENTSGNLDPIALLLDGDADLEKIDSEVEKEITTAVEEGQDLFVSIPDVFDRYSLVWNDDYRSSTTAAFEFVIPEDGSYKLLIGGAPGAASFGDFLLRVGLNTPEILDGRGSATGEPFVTLSGVDNPREKLVKQVTGLITAEEQEQSYILRRLNPGDTIYAYVEGISGDISPRLILRNFNNKPLRSGNLNGTERIAKLSLTLDQTVQNYKIVVQGNQTGTTDPEGNYRLLIGINDLEVLTGQAESTDRSPLEEPIEVQVGVKLQQITGIDQQSEKFGVVAEIRMEWQDPALAFNTDDCQCDFMTYSGDRFGAYADSNEILWPEFTLFNQQGNRWIQNRAAVVNADGRAVYLERFTTDLQAPLFDFVRFPFDEQQLFIQMVPIAPNYYFTLTDPDELSDIGDQLGEEEWYIVSSEHEVTIEDERDSYWLIFNVRRHLNFYIYRIFLPIGLVILVSWLTFFLKDYGKRVDVSSANLLVFVAFNFTISGDLPRLGYLTFMDAILVGTFVISIFVVLFSVVLKRLETDGREELAHRIDRPMIWLYPLLYVVGALVAIWMFLA